MSTNQDDSRPTFTGSAPALARQGANPNNRKALLFGTLEGAPILSMERFAETLVETLPSSGWNARLVRGPMGHIPLKHPIGGFLNRELSPHFLYTQRARHERRVPADVYHIIADAFSYIIDALPAERTVVTCHDLAPWQVPEIFSHWFGRTFGLRLWERGVRRMTRAAHITCDSEFTRQEVHNRLGIPLQKMTVVYLGISEEFYPYSPEKRVEARAKFNLPADACLVLHVGNAMVSKNPEGAIRTTALLRAKKVPAWFIKVGPVSDSQQALISELGLNDVYRRLRAPGDDGLRDVYNACDVLVFPSRNEGFGWPPLEAMRAGLPVIVSTTPALTETTGGLVPAFEPDDAAGMADAAQEIWERREHRDEAGVPGRIHAEAITWARTVSQIASIYDKVAG
jgi:glycosyltransferase involved in cell wall biosynthesis